MTGFRKVYINGRFLGQKPTGVQKYALGLTMSLLKKNQEIIILAPKTVSNKTGLKIKKIGFGNGFFWEQFWLPLFLTIKRNYILINFCNSAPLLIKKQIVTIHDLAFLKDHDWFSNSFRRWYKFMIPKICKCSLKVLTVSEFIKKEIITEYQFAAEKVVIIPNGIPEMKFSKESEVGFKYILLTGIYNKRKNASFVISQIDELKKRKLHIVGVGADVGIYGASDFSKDDNLHLYEYVDDLKYYSLLKHAEAIVFPSDYEGFGIPVLEALVLGTPAIISDLEVFKESFGNYPIYFSFGDKNSFIEAIDKLIISTPHTNDLSHLKNKYNFDESSEILSEILQSAELLGKNKSKGS